MERRYASLRRLALGLPLLLAACGGGVYLELGDGWGPPPTIDISASTGLAQRGETIRLVAAISAPNGIDRVSFYRIDPGATVTLATLGGPPVQLDTVIPLNAGRSVGYWARVCDEAGYCRESATVTVSVYP